MTGLRTFEGAVNWHTHTATRRERSARHPPIELFAHLTDTLYTAVVSDALDELGHREQAMAEHLRPVGANVKFAGWARTMPCMDCTT